MKIWLCPMCNKKYSQDEFAGVKNPECVDCGKSLRFPYEDSIPTNVEEAGGAVVKAYTPSQEALPTSVKLGTALIAVSVLLLLGFRAFYQRQSVSDVSGTATGISIPFQPPTPPILRDPAPPKKEPPKTEPPTPGPKSSPNALIINNVLDEDKIAKAVGLLQVGVEIELVNEVISRRLSLEFKSEREYLEVPKKERENWSKFGNLYGTLAGGNSGTAFLISSDGFAATNKHVIAQFLQASSQFGKQNAARVSLALEDVEAINPKLFVYLEQEVKTASLVHVSDEYDFAIIKIDDVDSYPFFKLLDGITISRKTSVSALGFPGSARNITSKEELDKSLSNERSGDPEDWYSPKDLSYILTSGEVSRAVETVGFGYEITHTATVDPGNSGGPLITDDGVVVGINTQQHAKVVDGRVVGTGINVALGLVSLTEEIRRENAEVIWASIKSKSN